MTNYRSTQDLPADQKPETSTGPDECAEKENYRKTSVATNNNVRKRSIASRSSSIESISGDMLISEYMSSDELEKLSMTLSEASAGNNGDKTTLFDDMLQAQLALWTFAFSLLYSYAWVQHRKKFLICIFVIIPVALTLTCIISWLLGFIVILGRFFTTPVNYGRYFDASKHEGYAFDRNMAREAYRQRSFSGASAITYTTENMYPMTMCRRHSSYTSLNSRPPSVTRKLSQVSNMGASN
ncbi:unnamed protein product [Caenorhabditis bovis]|uniref:Uncharacterized protein n=1 Tax=Caenorhabditis bovis TaxID=2654633 RepID=A0A8S1FFF1_9PELO|nr:unnamed protein product [Caenorhabditis bovis]